MRGLLNALRAGVAMLISPMRDDAEGLPRLRRNSGRTMAVAPAKPRNIYQALGIVAHHTGADGKALCGANLTGPNVTREPGDAITCNGCQRALTARDGKAAKYIETETA